MLEIVTLEDIARADVLTKIAEPLSFPLPPEVLDVIHEMKGILVDPGGLGIAAPQVNYSFRIFVFHIPEKAAAFRREQTDPTPVTVVINPTFEPVGDEVFADWEGCLSVPDEMGYVDRFRIIRCVWFDEAGTKIEKTLTGLAARIFQHETDHLNGRLIKDLFKPDLPHGQVKNMMPIRLQELRDMGRVVD